MTPDDFIARWKAADLTERAAAQSHFNDLCALLGEETPAAVDPRGEWYAFEKGATKATGGQGWADVWKRGCFAWEYKSKGRDLRAALVQLLRYAGALENPPLLIVSDLARFEIRTNWTNTVSQTYEIALDDLRDARKLRLLKWAFAEPERLKPGLTRQSLTEEVAAGFARLATRLRARGHPAGTVAHFVNRLVFCMFAEDVGLLPERMFGRMLDLAAGMPEAFAHHAALLFAAMREGGFVGFERIAWFNGGLFDDNAALPLNREDIALVRAAAGRDWAEIDPSIFGTLFERGLDPDKRSQLGAHYTDCDKIALIIEPVITRPWLAEWDKTKAEIAAALQRAQTARAPAARTRAQNEAAAAYRAFLDRLRAFRVLDPACGSGNFLYLALLALKDIEHRAAVEAEAQGLPRELPQIGPQAVKGIEINPYAAELARVTVWIGEIQWMLRNGFGAGRDPILKPLDTIECRDAILAADGGEAQWPAADVVIGNPPFLGNKAMLSTMGQSDVRRLRGAFAGRLPGGVDLVTYWFEKARALLEAKHLRRAGLVATQAIRRGANRNVLDRIAAVATIFDAWADEPWILDGAAVRVSLVCFGQDGAGSALCLNGQPVSAIHTDLSSGSIDLTVAARLRENAGICFQGPVKVGPFDISGDLAREWLQLPLNPNGRGNADVVRPWLNGRDLTDRPSDTWIVDFNEMSESEAALYEAPFEYVRATVKPFRDTNNRVRRRRFWWQHGETVPGLRSKAARLSRLIGTPRVAKHRLFLWIAPQALPDSRINVIARDEDTVFGLLHSRFHEAWALGLGSRHGDGSEGGRPTYNNETCFGTYPFPDGLTPDRPAAEYAADPRALAIAAAARRLDELRRAWLNPPDLVARVPEVVAGYPDRIVPADAKAAALLKTRTLTNLYNARPAWLAAAHRDLDAAVAAAYGWPADIAEEEALARLLALNRERAAAGR